MNCDQCERYRSALVGLIGVDSEEELKQMELMLRMTPAPDKDKANALNAIHLLLERYAEHEPVNT